MKLFSESFGSIELLRAIGGEPSDGEWSGGGSVQKLGGATMEADGSVLEVGAGEQNVAHLFTPLFQPVERLLEYLHIIVDTPIAARLPRCALIRNIRVCYNFVITYKMEIALLKHIRSLPGTELIGDDAAIVGNQIDMLPNLSRLFGVEDSVDEFCS